MEYGIMVGLSLALILFVWVWIGIAIVQRLALEKKIEKLANIENRLPEEERALNHLQELRMIEQNKVGSAKVILGLFGGLIALALGLAVFYPPMHALFGFENLTAFASTALVVLTFMVLPTYVGLTLAGSNKKDPLEKKEKVSGASA
jgi:hypothetical protein